MKTGRRAPGSSYERPEETRKFDPKPRPRDCHDERIRTRQIECTMDNTNELVKA